MALPHRKRQTKKPTSLPKDFLNTVSVLFHKQFAKNLAGSSFLIFGDLFSDEAVFAVSLANPKSLPAASLHISADLEKDIAENPEKVTEQLKKMVDVAASWFSQCFQEGNGLEAVLKEIAEIKSEWQPLDWEGQKLYVKLNKNNYTLEKAADEFLRKKGFAQDGEDPLDEFEEDENSEEDLN